MFSAAASRVARAVFAAGSRRAAASSSVKPVVPAFTATTATATSAGSSSSSSNSSAVVLRAAAAVFAAGTTAAYVYDNNNNDNEQRFDGILGGLSAYSSLLPLPGLSSSSYVTAAPDSAVTEATAKNRAFVFIKPHAVTDAVAGFLEFKLLTSEVAITGQGEIDAKTIDEQKLIDTHYGAIASKAMDVAPSDLNVPAKGQAAFAKAFGTDWTDAIKANTVYNAAGACKKLGIDGGELDAKWSKLTRGQNLIKFGGGFYCGEVDGIFVINGFYMSMRRKFTEEPARIRYYLVEWDPAKLSWEQFRGEVLGATDPKTAVPGSARREIYNSWESLGLSAQPDVGDNGVHASASPFEAMAERINWVGATVENDAFGKGMLASGIDKATVIAWCSDPQVKGGSLFDALEDMDAAACLDKAVELAK